MFVNNLLYNDSAGYTTHTSTNFKHDIVNNYFVFGPASTGTDNTWYQIDKNQSIYYAGNLKDTNLNGTLDGSRDDAVLVPGDGNRAHEPLVDARPPRRPRSTRRRRRASPSRSPGRCRAIRWTR